MKKADYLFEALFAFHPTFKTAFTYKIGQDHIDIILRMFWKSKDEITNKYIDLLELKLEEFEFQDYEMFYDSESEYLLDDFFELKKEEWIETITKYGIEATLYFAKEWRKLDTLRVKNSYGTSLIEHLSTEELAFILAQIDKEEAYQSNYFDDEVISRYYYIISEVMSSIGNLLKSDTSLYEQFLFDANVVNYGFYNSIHVSDLEEVFVYYFSDLITSDTLCNVLEYCEFDDFPYNSDYEFIKEFKDEDSLRLWFKLQ